MACFNLYSCGIYLRLEIVYTGWCGFCFGVGGLHNILCCFHTKCEDTFAHGINIRNNYQLFHLLCKQVVRKDVQRKYTFLKARLVPEFALKKKGRLRKSLAVRR